MSEIEAVKEAARFLDKADVVESVREVVQGMRDGLRGCARRIAVKAAP